MMSSTIIGNWNAPELKQQLRLRGLSVDASMAKLDMIQALRDFDEEVHVSSSGSRSNTRGKSQNKSAIKALKAGGMQGFK